MKLFSWISKHNDMTDKKTGVNPALPIYENINDSFNSLINENVKQILKTTGFKKKALTFFKQGNELIYVINFQKSQGNSSELVKFYVNCGIYSALIDRTIGKSELLEPKEYECHYSVRISTLVNSKEDGYKIDRSTDLKSLAQKLSDDLGVVLRHFENYESTSDLTNLMTDYNSLDYNLFDYFILKGDEMQLRKQLQKINELWSSESRWRRIKNDLNIRLREHNKNQTIEEIIENK